jgi:Flp pilus assembly protein TadG
MRSRPVVPAHRRNQRGIALAYFGVAMLTLVSFAVIGIDIARLGFTASEVQSVADAAALAAALAKSQNSTDPVAQAALVAQQNKVDGDATDVGAGEVVESITPGFWDFDTGTFTASTWDDPVANAAKAHATKTVDNFIAAAIGAPQSSVTRESIAAIGGACDGRPLMPMAVGDCFFEQFAQGDPEDPNRCSSLPRVQMANDLVDSACFTSLGSSSASASQARAYLPPTCCQGGNCGGGQSPPLVSIGEHINIMNGQATSVYQVIGDCLQDGLKEWDVPLVKCNQHGGCPNGAADCVKCNQQMEVTGFAHIVLDMVKSNGNPKFIKFHSICKTTPSSSPGCHNSSSFGLAIVK